MKIIYSIPDEKIFNHYSPYYKILRILKIVLIVFSSATVFKGILDILDLSGIDEKTGLIGFILICLAAFIICLAFDTANTKIADYSTRSFFDKKFKRVDMIILVLSLSCVAALTFFSFTMSKDSASIVSFSNLDNDVYDNKQIELSDSMRSELDTILFDFDKKTNSQLLIYDNLLNGKRERIKTVSKSYGIKRTERDSIKMIIDSEIAEIETKKSAYLEQRDSVKNVVVLNFRQSKKIDEKNGTLQNKSDLFKEKLNNFINKFTFLSGWSIVLALICSCSMELIRLQSGSRPVAIISQGDFQISAASEFISNFTDRIKDNTLNWSRYYNEKRIKQTQDVILPDVLPDYTDKKDMIKRRKGVGLSFGKREKYGLYDKSGNLVKDGFNSKSEAEEWVKQVYPDGDVTKTLKGFSIQNGTFEKLGK